MKEPRPNIRLNQEDETIYPPENRPAPLPPEVKLEGLYLDKWEKQDLRDFIQAAAITTHDLRKMNDNLIEAEQYPEEQIVRWEKLLERIGIVQ